MNNNNKSNNENKKLTELVERLNILRSYVSSTSRLLA
jgi:hypothetical protein